MAIDLMEAAGPSPRIRGELLPRQCSGIAAGTIPANTGRILSALRNHDKARDHPREYGENWGY